MNKQLYFLHIPKVGGINISTSVIFNKNISFYDTSNEKTIENFYSAQYLYGHMGKTPIEKIPGISVACLFRDPLERFVSNFIHSYNTYNDKIFKNKAYSNIENIEDKLKYYLFEDLYYSTVTNFQSRTIFNIMTEDAFENMFKKFNDLNYKNIEKENNLWYLCNNSFSFEDIKNIVDSFEITGTTDNHDDFFEKISKWFLDNYNQTIINNPNEVSFIIDKHIKHTTKSLLESLTENEKETFKSRHSIDFELYNYIKNSNG
jgi:hypothetical protein